MEEAGETCSAQGGLDSSGVQVPDGSLTGGENILWEGCLEEQPIMEELGEQPAPSALFFYLCVGLRWLPCWQDMPLTKRNTPCCPSDWENQAL